MISNPQDIWRLESKWSHYDRKLAEVSYDFFLNFTCAHKHSRQQFGQFAWIIGLVTLRITTNRTYS